MKLPLYNNEGKKDGDTEVSDVVFGAAVNPAVIHQVYLALENNARQPWAHTKNRGEVRGGGKKPWKQKGTGRARHGSIRSPLWVGGGVTFGPLNTRNYKQKINKKMRRTAVRMCLSGKVLGNQMMVLKDSSFEGKTKKLYAFAMAMPGAGKSTLILTSGNNSDLTRATRNMPKVDVQRAEDVNVADLMHHQFIIATDAGVKTLEQRLA